MSERQMRYTYVLDKWKYEDEGQWWLNSVVFGGIDVAPNLGVTMKSSKTIIDDLVHWDCHVAPWNHGQPLSPVGLKIDTSGGKPLTKETNQESSKNWDLIFRSRSKHITHRFHSAQSYEDVKLSKEDLGLAFVFEWWWLGLGIIVQVLNSWEQTWRHVCEIESSDTSSSVNRCTVLYTNSCGDWTQRSSKCERSGIEANHTSLSISLSISLSDTTIQNLVWRGGRSMKSVDMLLAFHSPLFDTFL